MNDLPLVSCITPTYGRFEFLREMYWCWNRQSYENKELIIVNDQPNLEIICDDPRVIIRNYDHRLDGLGHKRNVCVSMMSEESIYMMPFDDDDLFLPDHILSLVGGHIDTNNEFIRTKNLRHFITRNNLYEGTMVATYPFFGASCFNAQFCREHKFNHAYVMGEDVTWMDDNSVTTYVVDGPTTFAYRMGMGIVHASGHHIDITNTQDQNNLSTKITNSINDYNERRTIKLTEHIANDSKLLYDMCLHKGHK